MEHVPVAYPSVAQGVHSIEHLVKGVLGTEPLPLTDVVAHSWVALGAGLSQVFPPDMMSPAIKADLLALQEAHSQAVAGAIEWSKYVKLLLQFLLGLL